MKMALSIIDIAKMAGVSKSTVSRYLNTGYVSEEAKEKIQAVLDETGYKPQRHAKSMRTKKTNLIGVIVPKISTTTAARVIEGVTDVLSQNGYDILIANTNLSTEKEIEYLKIFRSNQVDGIIFMATKVTDEHVEIMKMVEVPIVVVAQKIDEFPSVFYDDYTAAKEATSFLLEKGHENIGFIGVYEEDVAVGVHRKNGYKDALVEKNIKVIDDNILIGDFSSKSGYELAKNLMGNEIKPTAILAVTDNLAIGAMEYLKESNYKIPEDIAVMGMGDSNVASVVSPKLTTVHFHYKTSGIKASEILLYQIENPSKFHRKKVEDFKIKCGLIKRASV